MFTGKEGNAVVVGGVFCMFLSVFVKLGFAGKTHSRPPLSQFLQVGLSSSHLTRRLLQVKQPDRDRLENALCRLGGLVDAIEEYIPMEESR